jgi:hypothetical protein
MWACKSVALVGPALLGVFMPLSAAEAKRIRYDIDGQTYSYDSNDRGQAAIAQERIQAAKAADEARAKASAQRRASPWVRLFGSPVQTEADMAEAALKRALATTAMPAPAKDIARSPVKSPQVASVETRQGRLAPTTAASARRHPAQKPPAAATADTAMVNPRQHVHEAALEGKSAVGVAAVDPDIRAQLIAQFRASALAEEQRRLESARRQDGFVTSGELSAGTQAHAAFTSQPRPMPAVRALAEPTSTGSGGAADLARSERPQTSHAAVGQPVTAGSGASVSSRTQGLCGMIFFGLLSRC